MQSPNATPPALAVPAVAVAAVVALILSSCGAEEPAADEPTPSASPTAQTTLRVGVQVDSPGLASGVDPSSLSGLDVDLVTALTTELTGTAVEWVPITAVQAPSRLAEEEIDLALIHGPVNDARGATVVGPYVSTIPALLVSAADSDALPGDGEWEPVAELADLDATAVCVPEGTDQSLLTLEDAGETEILEQPSTAECALALTSGRVQAVLSDRVQLTGLAEDPRFAGQTQVLEWADLSEDTAPAVEYHVLVGAEQSTCTALFGILSDPDRMESLLSASDAVRDSESAADELSGAAAPC
ncbi:MAG: substrate-binding periplasmic protein [Micrococcaceae bacterium]